MRQGVGIEMIGWVSSMLVLTIAATLHASGQKEIATAADVVRALEPAAGPAAGLMFAVGFMGASMLAAAVLPLATSYAVSEAFGFPKGVNLDFRRARVFLWLFSALIFIGGAVALIPKLPVINLLVLIQVLNGALLPIILIFILRLINDERLTGELKNTRFYNILGWGTFALVTAAVTMMLGTQLLGLLGVKLFGK